MNIWVLQRHVLQWTQDTERGRRKQQQNTTQKTINMSNLEPHKKTGVYRDARKG